MRKVLRIKKVGHSGTLDPIASGVLLVCVGRATRLLDYLMDLPKSYVAWVKLGVTTDTLDSTGKVLEVRDIPEFEPDELEAVLDEFRGKIMQTPPMFSAIKRDGKKLYVLARQGEQIDIEPRPVTLHDLELLSQSRSTLKLSIHCSKGTYVRSLCADIGERLGCGAHVFSLRRTSIGQWDVEDAIPYSKVFALGREQVTNMLEPIEKILPSFAQGEVSPLAERYALNGLSIDMDQMRCTTDLEIGDPVVLRTWRGTLIGVFRAKRPSPDDLSRRPSLPMVLRPEKVLLTSRPAKKYRAPNRRRSSPSKKGYYSGRGEGRYTGSGNDRAHNRGRD